MGITKTNKEVSTARIDCGDSFDIKLSITAEPDIIHHPTDIVLILDRSGSMAGSPLAHLKAGAKKFIEIIDEATDNTQDGHIGQGSRIGIVSFSSTASQDTRLITSVSDLNAAVNALAAGGSTNHADAFAKATQLFDMTSQNEKVMVMFTDGVTTAGAPPAPVAEAARAQGIVIYCIGLEGQRGVDVNALKEWASEPDSAYVAVTPDEEKLEELFAELAQNLTKPGATDIVITDHLSPCFRVVAVGTPTKGTASIISDTAVKWEIDELGKRTSEGATFAFTVRHVGPCTGPVAVNTAVDYSDKQGNVVTFPSPGIDVECADPVVREACPEPKDITIGGCSDMVEFDAGDLYPESLGRILELSVTLKNICPNRRVALGAIVTEVDEQEIEHKRGIKTLVIPAHTHSTCRDVVVRCIKFVLPEVQDVSQTPGSICDGRRFRARFIAHYIDNDFDCCNTLV